MKILFHSNYSRLYTGHGKNMRNMLTHFHNKGYEVVEACNWVEYGQDPALPWKAYGTKVGDPNRRKQIEAQGAGRLDDYGFFHIDDIIEKENPDIYIGIEDIWAFDYFEQKKWWKKIPKLLWVTLDSLPLHPRIHSLYPDVEGWANWASFATEEMHRLGYNNAETVHGLIDYSVFSEKSKEEKAELRKSHGIDENDFVFGFVFKNQLRKSVPNLLRAFKQVKEEVDGSVKLLLHTDLREDDQPDGKFWNILEIAENEGVSKEDLLFTYICRDCGHFQCKPHTGDANCPKCNAEGKFKTRSLSEAVTDEDLNDIYNLMDVYVHPFTSGGQEIPIQEAKAAGLPTIVTRYSCGTDSCKEEHGGIPVGYSPYWEPFANFEKASTDIESLTNEMINLYHASNPNHEFHFEFLKLKENSKNWVKENFSLDVNFTRLESLIDKTVKRHIKVLNEEPEESKETHKDKITKAFEGAFPKGEDIVLLLLGDGHLSIISLMYCLPNLRESFKDKKIYISCNQAYWSLLMRSKDVDAVIGDNDIFNEKQMLLDGFVERVIDLRGVEPKSLSV